MQSTTFEKPEQVILGIIGLGYVGLPLAVEFSKQIETIGFDINSQRVRELRSGQDHTLEVEPEELQQATKLRYADQLEDLRDANVFIVTVPTPIDEHKRPDLTPLIKASESIGKVIKQGDVVIYEATVYPSAAEEDCIPVIERVSGLKFNQDFFAGYSPERINLGDKEPEIILDGRRINDGMGRYVVSQLVKAMVKKRIQVEGARVLVMGLTVKENCPDLRNTRVVFPAEVSDLRL